MAIKLLCTRIYRCRQRGSRSYHGPGLEYVSGSGYSGKAGLAMEWPTVLSLFPQGQSIELVMTAHRPWPRSWREQPSHGGKGRFGMLYLFAQEQIMEIASAGRGAGSCTVRSGGGDGVVVWSGNMMFVRRGSCPSWIGGSWSTTSCVHINFFLFVCL